MNKDELDAVFKEFNKGKGINEVPHHEWLEALSSLHLLGMLFPKAGHEKLIKMIIRRYNDNLTHKQREYRNRKKPEYEWKGMGQSHLSEKLLYQAYIHLTINGLWDPKKDKATFYTPKEKSK